MTSGWIVAVWLVATSSVRRPCVPLLANHPVSRRVNEIFKSLSPKLAHVTFCAMINLLQKKIE